MDSVHTTRFVNAIVIFEKVSLLSIRGDFKEEQVLGRKYSLQAAVSPLSPSNSIFLKRQTKNISASINFSNKFCKIVNANSSDLLVSTPKTIFQFVTLSRNSSQTITLAHKSIQSTNLLQRCLRFRSAR